MKWALFIFFLVVSNVSCVPALNSIGRTINYPVFDRTDSPELRIEKIFIDNDTTYVFCDYITYENSWVSISKETFLQSHETGEKYPILRCEGIPFSPENRYLRYPGEYKFLFCFPAIKKTEYIDFIESPNEIAFNIYGISLIHENDSSSAQYSIEQIESLMDKVEFYNSMGNYEKAIELAEQDMNACKAMFGCKSSVYAHSVNNLIYHCFCGEEYEKVVQFGENNTLLCEELFGAESDEYGSLMQILASGYHYLSISNMENNHLPKALEFAKKAVALIEKQQDDDFYYDVIGNLGTCFYVNGYYKDALRIGNKRYDLLVHKKGKSNWRTIDAALRLSNYYGALGFYDEKEKRLLEVINEAQKDTSKMALPLLSTALNNISMHYVNHNPQKALKYAEESYRIRKELLDNGNLLTDQSVYNLNICQSLYNIGICLYEMSFEELNVQKGTKALDYIFEALDGAKSILGENDYRYADMKGIITDFMFLAQKYEEAINNEKEILQIYSSSFGTKHLSFLKSQERLANLYFFLNNKTKLIEYVNRVIDGYEFYIYHNFPILTSVEKEKLFNNMEYFYDQLLPAIAYYQNSSEINSILCNAQLFRKGILLSADLDEYDIVKETKDATIIKMYNNIIAQKRLLYEQYQIPVGMRTMNTDSLEKAIAVNEDILRTSSVLLKNNFKRKQTKWKDIQKEIGDGDLVIEFISFMDTTNIAQEHYMALAFSKESLSPELIHLFAEDEMDDSSPSKVSQLVWKPILEKYKDKQTIYFSPTGLLNNIGIEYMISSANSANHYQVFRLSSTRELVGHKTEKILPNAVLYGGLSYDVETCDMIVKNDSIEEPLDFFYRSLISPLVTRGGFDPLPNSISEVNEIGKILGDRNIRTTLLTGKDGTEHSFKNLSGQNVSIMHLATHGMYIAPTEASYQKTNNNFQFIQLGEDELREDYALTRSFLVMAGGNFLPRHASIPMMEEDGILTALDISTLDFKGLDLVVLSACQTALGDVNKEGVYGLQRAFKKAGASTILMSISKVDDEATRILMVEFYKSLMSGKTKYQSLRDAQKRLRTVENGKYDDPKYWASFIMLDGLN